MGTARTAIRNSAPLCECATPASSHPARNVVNAPAKYPREQPENACAIVVTSCFPLPHILILIRRGAKNVPEIASMIQVHHARIPKKNTRKAEECWSCSSSPTRRNSTLTNGYGSPSSTTTTRPIQAVLETSAPILPLRPSTRPASIRARARRTPIPYLSPNSEPVREIAGSVPIGERCQSWYLLVLGPAGLPTVRAALEPLLTKLGFCSSGTHDHPKLLTDPRIYNLQGGP